jgi:hypothetical protein
MSPSEEKILVERHAVKGLVLYEITEDELERIETEVSGASDDFSVASIALSIAVSFTIALATTKIDSPRLFTVFCLFVMLGYFFTLLHGVKWFRGRRTRRHIVTKIKTRVGPLGDEKNQITGPDLVALENQESKD